MGFIFRKIRTGSAHAQRVMAFVTLVCGFCMMWGSSRGSMQSGSTNEALRSEAREIDPLLPDGKNNQSIVVAAGRFSTPETLEDDFLKPGKFLILKRHIEMFQWAELPRPLSKEVDYSLGWHEGQIDFFGFKEPTGHENPLLRYEGLTRKASVSSFGAFDGSGLLQSVQHLVPLTITQEILKDPSLRIEENKIVVPRAAAGDGTPALGDMRVWYEVLPEGNYTVLTRQVDERNLVGADSGHAMVLRVGLLSAEQLFDAENSETEQVSNGLLYAGGLLFFVGLYSVLSPLAASFTLKPKIDLEGAPALAFVCAVLSLAAVIIFFVVGQLG